MSNLINEATALYEESIYKNILQDIKGIKIPFDFSYKNIAVAVSGGADSALLCYILCNIISENNLKTNVHVISNIRNWKNKPWQEYNGIEVYNYLTSKFPNITFYRHVNFVPPEFEWGNVGPNLKDEYGKITAGDIIELRAFSEYVIFKNKIEGWYIAVNKNPNDLKDQGELQERSIDKIDFKQLINQKEHVILFKPFLYLEKNIIIKLYKDLGIDDLLSITRSCEGEIPGLNYKNYISGQDVPLCGTCFWCKERQWGIENAK